MRARAAALAAMALAILAVAAPPRPAAAALPEAPLPAPPREPLDRWIFVAMQGNAGAQPDEALRQVYGPANPFSLEARAVALFSERIGGGLGAGFQIRGGTGVAPSGEPPSTRLLMVPIFVEGVLRGAFRREQPALPYLRAGFDALLWRERDGAGNPRGVKWGVHGAVGGQFRMPFPEIQFEGRLSGDPLLDDIYLHVELWGRQASSFGAPGLDLSSWGGGAGITLVL